MNRFNNNELKSAGFRIESGMTGYGETGRSMVEMLGVLAIMGVLSVAGIAGYSSAMDKHRANELMNAVSMRLMVLATQRATGTALSLAEFDNAPVSGSAITLNTSNQDPNTIELKLSNLPKAVCRHLYNSKGANVISMTSGNIVLTSADGCAVKADALITFNNDLSSGNGGSGNSGQGQQQVDPCAGFTATICTTACTNNNGEPVYTYAEEGTSCDTYSRSACDGKGNCYQCPTDSYAYKWLASFSSEPREHYVKTDVDGCYCPGSSTSYGFDGEKCYALSGGSIN